MVSEIDHPKHNEIDQLVMGILMNWERIGGNRGALVMKWMREEGKNIEIEMVDMIERMIVNL
jgi:hypothetical protein